MPSSLSCLPIHTLSFPAHQPGPPPWAPSFEPVPLFPCPLPAPVQGSTSSRGVGPNAGGQFLVLPLLHPTSTPVPRSLMGWSCNLVLPLSWVSQPRAAARCHLYPSLHRDRACRDSRSQHAGLCHQLSSPCLAGEGASHAKTCPPWAAACSW